jgi:choline-glycine betaine transporter
MSLFLARISRGRTLRTLVLTVAVAAPLATHVWFALVGGTGLLTELANPGQLSGPLAERGAGAAWVGIVSTLPVPSLWVGLAIVLVFCFLATTADSVSFAIAVVLSRNDEPPGALRVGVAVSMGVTALVLLWLGQGGIDLLQQTVVLTAVPVTLVMAVAAFGGVASARRLATSRDGSPQRPRG